MVRWSLPAVLGFVVWAARCLGTPEEFGRPNTYIGNADWDGGLVLWVEVAKIPVEEGVSLPLRLQFASKGSGALLGGHWWCPLLESGGRLSKPNSIEFSALGGRRAHLSRKNGFQSLDGKTQAKAEGDAVEIASGGWVFRYQEGRIVQAVTPKGTPLVWKYEDGRAGVRKADGTSLVEMARSGNQWRLAFAGMEREFVFQENKGSDGKLAGWTLRFGAGWSEDMTVEDLPEGVTEMRVQASDGDRGTYRWQTATGALLADADFTYEKRPTDLGRELLHRVDAKGLTEWYYYDAGKGAAIYKRQDGSRVVSWYDLRPGPANMKVFRMDTLSPRQELVSSRLLAYTPDGEVAKEWTEEGKAPGEVAGGIRFLSYDEAVKLHAEAGTLFVDARPAWAFAAGAIPGAVNVSRENFERDYRGKEEQLRKAAKLIVYCTSRNCEESSIVATKLSQLGYKNVLVFEGGWAEWWKHR